MKNKSTLLFCVTLVFCSAQTASASNYFSLAAIKGSLAGWWQGKSRNNDVYGPNITSFPATFEVHTVKAGTRTNEGNFDISHSIIDYVKIEDAAALQRLLKDLKESPNGKIFVVKIPSSKVETIEFNPHYKPSAELLLSLQPKLPFTPPITTPSTTAFKKRLENSARPTAFTKPIQTTTPRSFPKNHSSQFGPSKYPVETVSKEELVLIPDQNCLRLATPIPQDYEEASSAKIAQDYEEASSAKKDHSNPLGNHNQEEDSALYDNDSLFSTSENPDPKIVRFVNRSKLLLPPV